jgi:hypothetical protein
MNFLANAVAVMATIWRSRSILLLIVGILVLGPLVIGIHASSHADQQALPLLLFARPDVAGLAPVHHQLSPKAITLRTSSDMSPFFASAQEEGRRGQALDTKTLDDIYRFLVPFVMVLVGANILPHQERVYGALFSLPGGKGLQFLLHCTALLSLVLLVSLSMLLVNALALTAAFGVSATRASFLLLFEYHVVLLLYALCFANLGFLGAITFRSRTTSIIATIVLVVLLVGAMPQFFLAASQTYVRSQAERIRSAGTMDVLLEDPVFMGIRFLGDLPGSAFANALEYLPELHRTVIEGGCTTCPTFTDKRALRNRAYVSMAIFGTALLVLGGAAFVRKEAGEA